jgi:hypothetical protein
MDFGIKMKDRTVKQVPRWEYLWEGEGEWRS